LENVINVLIKGCSGAEELSVKTLADMFDFKLGEEPAKPPLSSR
jgi:hypothetical protein